MGCLVRGCLDDRWEWESGIGMRGMGMSIPRDVEGIIYPLNENEVRIPYNKIAN